jgi:membrane-bound lytic murein transglycosylase D
MRAWTTGGRWGRAAGVVPLLIAMAGCTAWGGEGLSPPAPPASPGPTEIFLQKEWAALGSLTPSPIPPLHVQVRGIDPILHNPTSLDSGLQGRKAFWVEYWTLRQPDHFRTYLARMGRYGALVDAELERRGLPESLRYLPIVESGYRPGAVSRVGATGLWQIMGPTARSLAMTVSPIVDDRRDPVDNTRAALDFLEELHRGFDSWHLALAAYNAGPARIRGLLARHAPDVTLAPDERFLLIRPHLPAETRDFIPKLLAAAQVSREAPFLGLCPETMQASLTFDEVTVPDATSLDVVAFAAGVPESEVVALNPQYLRGFTPPGQVRVVRVPAGAGERFREEYARIPPEERLSFLEHVVARGETFTHIARRYRVPLAELIAANDRIDPRRLQIGTRVVVPVAGSVRAGS